MNIIKEILADGRVSRVKAKDTFVAGQKYYRFKRVFHYGIDQKDSG